MPSKSSTTITLPIAHPYVCLPILEYSIGPKILPRLKELVAMVSCHTN